jgi:hypothetical protein
MRFAGGSSTRGGVGCKWWEVGGRKEKADQRDANPGRDLAVQASSDRPWKKPAVLCLINLVLGIASAPLPMVRTLLSEILVSS